MLIIGLLDLGDRAGVEAELVRYQRRVGASHQPRYAWSLGLIRATLAMLDGRFTDAERLAAEAQRLGEAAGRETATIQYAQQLAVLRYH